MCTAMQCFFASDLHGRRERYEALLDAMQRENPRAVFLGGDLLPMDLDLGWATESDHRDFISDFLAPAFRRALDRMETRPRVFMILGNDDARFHEENLLLGQEEGIWEYVHGRSVPFEEHAVHGYAFVPPTPFQLKDWERYDVSRFVDPGCFSPEEGRRSVAVDPAWVRFGTIQKDLEAIAEEGAVGEGIFLFHSPPYRTLLDRADLDGQKVDHVPVDPHIGSIAIRRFIEKHQPRLTLHGHVHESARITGEWMYVIGKTVCLQAAHDGPELSLIRFDSRRPGEATRELIPV